MGLSNEIAEKMADAGVTASDVKFVKDPARVGVSTRTIVTTFAIVGGVRVAIDKETHRHANANAGIAAPAKPGKVSTRDAKVDPIIGRRFRDAWGMELRVTRVEPGHVWARAGMLGNERRYLRSKIRPCLLPA